MNILHVKSTELTHILYVRCGLCLSLPFKACFAITVNTFIRRLIRLLSLETRAWDICGSGCCWSRELPFDLIVNSPL